MKFHWTKPKQRDSWTGLLECSLRESSAQSCLGNYFCSNASTCFASSSEIALPVCSVLPMFMNRHPNSCNVDLCTIGLVENIGRIFPGRNNIPSATRCKWILVPNYWKMDLHWTFFFFYIITLFENWSFLCMFVFTLPRKHILSCWPQNNIIYCKLQK